MRIIALLLLTLGAFVAGRGFYSPHVQSSLPWPQPSGSRYTTFRRGSIATDNGLCSDIGRDVMMIGGNAIEATIASLLCVGVVNPQSSGLGGGFVMTLFNKTTGRCVTIDAREAASASASESMYVEHPVDSSYGYSSIAVPSELHGFYTVFTRFGSGRVSWKRLVEPAMKLAARGFPVSNNLAFVLMDRERYITFDEHMTKEFVNPATGRVYREGEYMRREALAKTLEQIGNAADPIGLFYRNGPMAQTIASEFKKYGAHVTARDLAEYRTLIEYSPLVINDLPGGLSMCGPPPPSSFVVMQAIVRAMARFYNGSEPTNLDDPLIYHRFIETQKFAYAQRAKLGDTRFVRSAQELITKMLNPNFISSIVSKIKDHALPMEDYADIPMSMREDHGTSHVSAIDEEGNAVSCTSTANQLLGSMKISPTLGIIWNDEMDDFSTPGQTNMFGFAPSEANFIAPGKRPMSSMCPTIIYKDGEVKMVTGAAGGSFIISSAAQAIIHTLLFNRSVKEAQDAPRFHHQYLPHHCDYEQGVPVEIIEALRNRHGQTMNPVTKLAAVVQSLEVSEDGYIHGNSDFRRKISTYPAGF